MGNTAKPLVVMGRGEPQGKKAPYTSWGREDREKVGEERRPNSGADKRWREGLARVKKKEGGR